MTGIPMSIETEPLCMKIQEFKNTVTEKYDKYQKAHMTLDTFGQIMDDLTVYIVKNSYFTDYGH